MKKLSVVAMLIALAVAPVATAFAAPSTLQLPADLKERLEPNAVGPELTFLQFYLLAPTASTQALNLTFILAVNNILNTI